MCRVISALNKTHLAAKRFQTLNAQINTPVSYIHANGGFMFFDQGECNHFGF